MDPLEAIGLIWVTTLVFLTCVNTEFYTHLILFSREEKAAIFGDFINGSKDYFHQKLLLPANKEREAKGLDLIAVDEGLCKAVRMQVLAVANNWPYNVAQQPQNIFLAYANLSSFQGLSKEYLENTRYICCDKAVRSDDITFIICGFSTIKFQPDGAPGFLNDHIKSAGASTAGRNHSNGHATPQELPARHEFEATSDNNTNETDLDSIQVLNEPKENSLSENYNNSTRKRVRMNNLPFKVGPVFTLF